MDEDRIKWIARPAFPRLPRLKAVESQTGNQVMKVMEVCHKLYLGQHVFLPLSTSELATKNNINVEYMLMRSIAS